MLAWCVCAVAPKDTSSRTYTGSLSQLHFKPQARPPKRAGTRHRACRTGLERAGAEPLPAVAAGSAAPRSLSGSLSHRGTSFTSPVNAALVAVPSRPGRGLQPPLSRDVASRAAPPRTPGPNRPASCTPPRTNGSFPLPPRRRPRDGFALPPLSPFLFLRAEHPPVPTHGHPRLPIGCGGGRQPANPRRRCRPCRWGEENKNKQAGARAAEGAGPSSGSGGERSGAAGHAGRRRRR